MKKYIYPFIFLIIIFLTGCYENTTYQNNECDSVTVTNLEEQPIQKNKSLYNICELKDSIFKLYPYIGANDIQTNKACNYAFMEFTSKFNHYMENIPVKFRQMEQLNKSKYIVKFEAGEYTTDDKILINNGINLCIFGYVNEEVAETLINDKTYYISGSNITPYLTTPSGNTYILNVSYNIYNNIGKLSFSCVVKDIKITDIY